MDPLTITALITNILGGASNIIGTPGSKTGNASDVTNINQAGTDQLTQLLNQLMQSTQGQTNQLANQASGQYGALSQQGQQGLAQANSAFNQGIGQANQGYNSLTSLQGQLANMPGYNPNDANQLFQQNIPLYQDLATQARSNALSQFEMPAASQAMFQADQNVSSAANQFANLGSSTSGAAAAAAAQGAQAPLSQLAMDRANLGNQAYSSVYNPLLQQGQQNAVNQSQFGYNAGMEQLMQLIQAAAAQGQQGLGQQNSANQAAGTSANMLGQGAQGIGGLSSLYAGLQGNALNGLTSLGQPEYWQPTYTKGTGLMGIFG